MRTLARVSFLARFWSPGWTFRWPRRPRPRTPSLRELPETYLFGSGLPLAGAARDGHIDAAPERRHLSGEPGSARAWGLTLPSGGWTRAQWKSARLGFRGGGPPFFGWAAIHGKGGGHLPSGGPSGGLDRDHDRLRSNAIGRRDGCTPAHPGALGYVQGDIGGEDRRFLGCPVRRPGHRTRRAKPCLTPALAIHRREPL